jgi:hypothetical protein
MDGIQVRQQLDEILSSIEEREQVIAKALEDLTVDGAMTRLLGSGNQTRTLSRVDVD